METRLMVETPGKDGLLPPIQKKKKKTFQNPGGGTSYTKEATEELKAIGGVDASGNKNNWGISDHGSGKTKRMPDSKIMRGKSPQE